MLERHYLWKMVLYEAEKSVIVLDIGTAFTKFGFTGEHVPRSIFRTQVRCGDKLRNIFDYVDEQDLQDMLVEFFQDIYFKFALSSPKEKPIVIVESLMCPIVFRESLAKVLFHHFGVSSILLLSSHVVSLATLPVDSALVVDVGFQEANCIPVCYGMPLIQAWQTLNIGSQAIHKNLQTLLSEKNAEASHLTEKTLEDIKVRCCFVTKNSRVQEETHAKKQIEWCPDVKYPIEGCSSIMIPGIIREKAYEVLYQEDNDCLCLPTMILEALMTVNIDLRNQLAENILLIGGTTMAMGFKSRLKEELLNRLQEPQYSRLNIKSFKFHRSPSKENYTAWLGGSIYGATDWLTSKSFTKEVYFKENKLPDWSDLKYNSRKA